MSAHSGVVLETDRLVVRRLRAGDVDTIASHRNDPETARFQAWGSPYAREAAQRLVDEMAEGELFGRGRWTQLAVQRRDQAGMVGDLGVRVEVDAPTAEIGFTLGPEHRGLGYASEAVGALVEYLLGTRELDRIVAITLPANERARRVLERCGFWETGTDRGIIYCRDRGGSSSQRD